MADRGGQPLQDTTMLKGLALTPPVIGRISIGKIVERGGKRLPEKDDEFTVTSQVQSNDGWVAHPIDEALRKGGAGAKLRSIPVRLLFDDPELSLRANYSLFDRQTGRPLCVGDGETCRRVTASGMQSLPCPSPDACEVGKAGCKPFGRLSVRIGDEDELGSFVFRTTGFNSIRTLATRLRYFHAVSGGRLSTLPLELRLRGKSTTQSHRAPIYYADLTVRSGASLAAAITQSLSDWDLREVAGFDQVALDAAARSGLALGAFEESVEDAGTVIEEFFPDEDASELRRGADETAVTSARATLGDKLGRKLNAGSTSHRDDAC
jgi:hypothetical protein